MTDRAALLPRIAEEIERCRQRIAARYADPIFEVAVHEGEGRLRLSGTLFSPREHRQLLQCLEARFGSPLAALLDDGIEILIDRDRRLSRFLGWGEGIEPVLPVHADRLGRRLATELHPEDGPVKVILRKGDGLFVQAADLTLGWVEAKRLRWVVPQADPWGGIARAAPERYETISKERFATLLATLEGWLGTPYRLGGRTRAGIDCSALIQLAFREIGLLLPRHSRDQRSLGIRVPREALGPGDLLFVRPTGKDISHVALVTAGRAGSERVVHAARGRGGVIAEAGESFWPRYRLSAIRRIVVPEGATCR